MKKAIFLDRDGVINKELGNYVHLWEDFEFNEGLFEVLRNCQNRGYLLIIVTNQGGIAKGLFTEKDVEILMTKVLDRFKREGIEISEYYYSPHHDQISNSLDRKPESIMIEKGLARFGIDPAISYIIGDSERDVEAGKKAGLKTIKIDSNQNLSDIVSEIDDY